MFWLFFSEIMSSWLSEKGIPNTLILDAAVGYFMEKVDLVLTGAEGVAESGGIINKVILITNISLFNCKLKLVSLLDWNLSSSCVCKSDEQALLCVG